jgi:hypothetical protein
MEFNKSVSKSGWVVNPNIATLIIKFIYYKILLILQTNRFWTQLSPEEEIPSDPRRKRSIPSQTLSSAKTVIRSRYQLATLTQAPPAP